MTENDREWFNGCSVYFRILNKINELLLKIISDNMELQPEENEEYFYEMANQLLRLLPYTVDTKNNVAKLLDDGILLLKKYFVDIKQDYENIINKYSDILIKIIKIRNKFIHEPHNIKWAYTVGGKTSCSIGLYYKNDLQTISTIELTEIVISLNNAYKKILKQFKDKVDELEEEQKNHPYIENVLKFDFDYYNQIIPR